MDNDSNECYKALSPTEDIENENAYFKAINWAIKEENVRNLAITGTYGSGKSSIISTYLKKNKNKIGDYLEVSVAKFNVPNQEGQTRDSIQQENLEEYILQQLFYTVKSEEIPNSRFKKIDVTPKKQQPEFSNIKDRLKFFFLNSIKECKPYFWDFLAAIIVFLLVKYPILISKSYHFLEDFKYINRVFSIIITSLIIFILMSIVLWRVALIIEKLKKFKLSKISLGSTTLEGEDDSKKSVFNKYIDEIIYLFSNTKYNLVVFEDLDRFGGIEIFEKLRNLNTLINNNKNIKSENRKILFVYAIKDDIFSLSDSMEESQSRTKFFDFIIPIIKVVNENNTADKLLEFLEEYKSHEIDQQVILEISLFINDMRTLKNVCNEFVIMKEALGNEAALEDSKIFAMSVYKNLCPKDYTDLLNNRGIVYNIFNKKNQVIEGVIEKKSQKKLVLENSLENFEKNIEDSLLDLSAIMLLRFNKKDLSTSFNNIRILKIGNREINLGINDVKNFGEFMNKIIELIDEGISLNSEVDYTRYVNSTQRRDSISLKNLLSGEIDGDNAFVEKYKILKYREENGSKEIERELLHLKREIEYIHTYSISLLCKKYDGAKFIDFNDKDIIKYLIKEGLISENYPAYVSYYYEGLMSQNDRKFLKAILLGEELEKNLVLTNLEEIFKQIDGEKVSSKTIFNYQLFEWIFSDDFNDYNQNFKGKKNRLKKFLNENLNETVDFLNEFINGENEKESVIINIVEALEGSFHILWKEVDNKFSVYENKNKLIKIIIKNFTNEQLLRIASDGELARYISKNKYLLNLEEFFAEINNWGDKFKLIKVKFEDFEEASIPQNIAREILDKNIFDINLSILLKLFNIDKLTHKVLMEYPNIQEYRKENKDAFAKILLDQGSYEEDLEYAIKLLNDYSIKEEIRRKLIGNWNLMFNDLTLIEETEMQLEIIKKNKTEINFETLNTILTMLPENYEYMWSILLEKVFLKEEVKNKLLNEYQNEEDKVEFDKTLAEITEKIILEHKTISIETLKNIRVLLRPINYMPTQPDEINLKLLKVDLIEDGNLELLKKLNNIDQDKLFIKYSLSNIELLKEIDLSIEKIRMLLVETNQDFAMQFLKQCIDSQYSLNKSIIIDLFKRFRKNLRNEKMNIALESLFKSNVINDEEKIEVLEKVPYLQEMLDEIDFNHIRDLFKLDAFTLLKKVLNNNNLTYGFKFKSILEFLSVDREIDEFDVLNDYILQINTEKLDDGSEELNVFYDILINLAELYTDDEIVSKIILKIVNSFDFTKEYLEDFANVQTNHKKLAKNEKELTLQNTRWNEGLLKELCTKELIYNLKLNEDKTEYMFDTLN